MSFLLKKGQIFMPTASCTKIKHSDDNKKKIKLKPYDYAFEYKGEDLTNAYLEYSISSKEMTIFEDGNKRETINTTIIDITI